MLPYKVRLTKTGRSFALDFAPVKPVFQEWLASPSPFVSVSSAAPSPFVSITLPLTVHNSIEFKVHNTEFSFDVCTVHKRILHFHMNITRGARSPKIAARFCENAALVIFKAASFSSRQLVCPQKDPLHGPVILQQCVARSLVVLSFLFSSDRRFCSEKQLTSEPCAAIEILCTQNKPNLRPLVLSLSILKLRLSKRRPTKRWVIISCFNRNDQDYEAKYNFEFPACHLRKKLDEICILVFAILHVARASLGNQPISGLELRPRGITKCTSLINFARR